MTRAEHWDAAYAQGDTTRSWFQDEAAPSLRMLDRAGVTPDRSVIDLGGGASRLVDALLERGHHDVTVLDVSAVGIDVSRHRLGEQASRVQWIVTDLLAWTPHRTYDVWHDRAVFHFLTATGDRDRYLAALTAATDPGATLVLACFAPDGPEFCSGLPVARYDAEALAALLGAAWHLVADTREEHTTPAGAVQPFTWAAFRRGDA